MKTLMFGASLLAIVSAAPAFAQTTGPGQSEPTAPAAQGDIIVTAPFEQSEADVLQGTSVITGEELTRELRSTIGETLARQPGVSATSFGPNASRPVLRGLQGERIRVLTDGIGAFDVSNTRFCPKGPGWPNSVWSHRGRTRGSWMCFTSTMRGSIILTR